VGSFVQRHFGRGLVENIVDPLLMAVYGGDADHLSVQSVLPRLVELEQRSGSLIRGVRRAARERRKQVGGHKGASSQRPPLFTSLRDGLGSVVSALHATLDEQRVFCGRSVVAVCREADGYRIVSTGQPDFRADAVILALPAWAAALVLEELDRRLEKSLLDIHYSSSMIVALGYDRARAGSLPGGFGFLVPRREGGRVRACSFVGQKFSGRVPADRILLRCFLGGMRDETVLELSDEQATAVVRQELQAILGLSAEPAFVRVYRWPKAMALYTVGHEKRLQQIRQRLARHQGLFLAGNAYDGIGLPDCIRSGRLAAESCLELFQGG
jgi:oxygen-dependent protoporphyrinogen oxidase